MATTEIDFDLVDRGEHEYSQSEYIPYIPANMRDYESLENKPAIEHVELIGDRPLSDFGLIFATNHDIDEMFRRS